MCFEVEGRSYQVDLVVLPGLGIDVILGMKWMSSHGVLIDTSMRVVSSEILVIRKVF